MRIHFLLTFEAMMGFCYNLNVCEDSLSFLSSKPTSPHRGWFVPPFGGNPWWVYLASSLPALLVTILVFMDQQITAVIVNRKEHKLKVKHEAL